MWQKVGNILWGLVIFFIKCIYIILVKLGGSGDCMSIELIRDMINYEKLVGEGTGQMMVNGDIILGERSPEILNILNMDGKVTISSSECIEDKVILEGKMNFEVLYSSHDEGGSLHKVSAVSNFNHNIQVPGTKPHMPCKVETRIDHMDFEQVNNRKLKVNAIINIGGMVYEKNVVEAVTDIKAQDVQVLKNTVAVDELVAENSGQSIVRGKFEISGGSIESIVKREVFIYKKDVAVEDGKAVLSASARVRVLFENPEGETGALEQDVPFTSELNIPDLKHGMKCDVSTKVADVYDEIKEDENGTKNIIETEIVIDFHGRAYGKKEIENVVDAYSPSQRYEMEKETIKAISFFGEGSENEAIKERITLPDDVKPISKVKNMLVKPLITDTKVVEDKVIVEGLVNCCLIYLAAVEEGGVASYEEDIPFKTVVEMPGARIDMLPEVELHVFDIGFDQATDKNVDVKMIAVSKAKAFSKMTCDISKGALEAELPDSVKNMPSIVIYTVQNNDTLWKIAKKYSTTIEDIVTLNDLENPEMLDQNMKLLIPKKMFMK